MEVNTNLSRDHLLITISGSVDSDTLASLNKQLDQCLETEAPAVLVNCESLTHVCIAGLRSLLHYQRLLQNKNKRIIVFGLRDKIQSVFFETGLDRFISVASTYNQALSLVRQR
ncbi:STAS domain-containing protein [Adhaeribacter radiodurans]|uniref:STAS domain-containing protein n=1 Tax=Adhaeribacter radiodurans TaxID=2745197 RepID=A0A7L7L5A3_9BACT|nr:STAS domain-containing protein [Adhaeribacter radiodurans]QMU27982.1 STAS domain-containing protein [Adhaeribacter radiodurans]